MAPRRLCLLLSATLAVLATMGAAAVPGASATTVPPSVLVLNDSARTLTAYPLSASLDAPPSANLSVSGLEEPTAIALDGTGDVWVADFFSDKLVEYSKAQLAAGGTPTPLVTITSDGDLNEPTGLAFDASGDLWVANDGTSTVVEYLASELQASGSPAPEVTLSANSSHSIADPYQLSFDAAGDLWVPNEDTSTLVEFTPGQLTASGDPAPAVTISNSSSGSLIYPNSITFDRAGDLWTTTEMGNSILEYTPSELATGAPTPASTLTSDGSESVDDPAGAAFDAAGDLWVTNTASNNVVEFDPAQLSAGGSPTPVDTIQGGQTGLSGPDSVAVEQAPAVSSISTERGPTGTQVTVYGTGFYPGSTVDFGASPAASVKYVNPDQLTAVAPAGSGTVDVTVTTGQGTSAASAPDQFTYAAGSAVTPTVVVGNDGSGTLSSFPLSASGDAAPAATLSDASGDISYPIDGALDAAGDLWVPSSSNNTVREYTRSQLAAGGAQTPVVTVSSDGAGSLNDPSGAAFDAAGDLWVTNSGSGSVVEYTKAQLASGGMQVPAVTLSDDGSNSIDAPDGLDFDAAGDLWVSNFDGDTVIEYSKAELATNGSPVPAVTLSADASDSLATPDALTFDRHGDLWVTNGYQGNSVVEYTPGQLVTGAPTPAVTLSSDSSGSLNGSDQAQFDAAGDLWVADYEPTGSSGSIVEFTPAQLAASGSPIPENTITGEQTGLSNPWVLVIEQAPTVTTLSPAPAGGPAAGGTAVTISGTGFYPGSTVDFGGTPAAAVTYVSPYELTAVAPAGSGTVDVTVTTGEGTSDISSVDQFAYAASPPASGSAGSASATSPPTPHIMSSTHQLKLNGRQAGVTLSCSGATCQGTARITEQELVTVRHGKRKVRRLETVVLASTHYRLSAGHRSTIELRLSGATVAAIEHAAGRRISARLSATVTGGSPLNQKLTLIAPHSA
ncbi:MAG TPA: IPT/TIG domain-containing protein [Solirubrobacteraceae bacterium]|nr:IPT/TIG domain-containing protein [Solirubrobacteraceae bacterium]